MLSNLDRIFVLSLETSIERQREFRKNFPELISLDIFEWFFVKKDSENTERGCYISHQKILKLAKKRKYKTILILEDDIVPLVSWEQFVKEFNSLKRPKNWKVIQFGYLPIKTTKTTDKHLLALNCGYFAEAYLVNVELLKIPDYNGSQIDCLLFCNNNSHIDIIINPQLAEGLNKNMYVYIPRMFQQNFKDSDIGHNNEAIVAFYRFYGLFGDVTILSSYINLLLLVFLLVFLGISLLLITFLKLGGYDNNQLIIIPASILIIIVVSIVFTCFLNSQKKVLLDYEVV